MSNQRYAKLPNDNIALVSGEGQIVVTFTTDLNDIFEMAGDDLKSWLSEMATGDEDALSDVSFRILESVGVHGLSIEVAGTLTDIDVIMADHVPMQEFEVTVTRVSYGTRTIRLSAKTLNEAHEIAADDAGNHTYDEHHAKYVVNGQAVQ